MSWKVGRIGVTGMKGILEKGGTYDLKGKSLAIYAPNGHGKSALADALEYLFSQDGTVDHLGQGGPDSERGGKHALVHVLADEKQIPSEIMVTLQDQDRKNGSKSIEVKRRILSWRKDSLPQELVPIIRVAPAHRILRQHDLRHFVVDMEPRAKYTELSRWLGLERLEQVLAHITTVETALEKASQEREITERVQDLIKHTNKAVSTNDSSAAFMWCLETAKHHLGQVTAITSTEELELVIQALKGRRDELVFRSGQASEQYTARHLLETAVTTLCSSAGLVTQCEQHLLAFTSGKEQVERLRANAKESIFQKVWEAAKFTLERHSMEVCPTCMTPWGQTCAGTQEQAIKQITDQLKALSELMSVEKTQVTLEQQLVRKLVGLKGQLDAAHNTATKLALTEMAAMGVTLARELDELSMNSPITPTSAHKCSQLLANCRQFFTVILPATLKQLPGIEVPVIAQDIERDINCVQGVKDALIRLSQLQREQEEYRRIERNFELIAAAIREHAATYLNNVVAALQEDMTAIYKKIHTTDEVPTVSVTVDAKAKTMSLRIGFHSPDRKVPPAGYLSEAQINTLGLALFLSAVHLFNDEFPFIVLDDIVSSYDADHRAKIVDVIAEDLQRFQVILTTHDERFYTMLKSRLQQESWKFTRITRWTLLEGPRYEDDVTPPEQITQLIRQGDTRNAGNALRQYIEDWLDKKCAKYEARTIHKRGTKDFDRTISELWDAFIKRLREIKGNFFTQHIEPILCYQKLKTNIFVLNFYSHAQANPHEYGAIGDVAYVWEVFQEFENCFKCTLCHNELKYDRERSLLYCSCDGAFVSPERVGTPSSKTVISATRGLTRDMKQG